ncbi:unnamed protein product [Brassica oleracea var. botrytis]|uniref:Uncharacterized protein n=1 Tax=Brassica oleracea TaxID=3712 RepID=A0A3P6CZM7_BRAOL|nr:unnamed protein product [Brassica oleracea]
MESGSLITHAKEETLIMMAGRKMCRMMVMTGWNKKSGSALSYLNLEIAAAPFNQHHENHC